MREIVARPYAYAGHVVPHDAQARELGTGKSRLEVLASLGLNNITLGLSVSEIRDSCFEGQASRRLSP